MSWKKVILAFLFGFIFAIALSVRSFPSSWPAAEQIGDHLWTRCYKGDRIYIGEHGRALAVVSHSRTCPGNFDGN